MTSSSIDFDLRVALTVHGGFLAAAGVLLTDPVVHVSELTVRTGNQNGGKEVTTTMDTRRLGTSDRRVFTAHPTFEETFRLVLPHLRGAGSASAVTRHLVLDVEGSNGEFLGQAICPFPLSTPSRGTNRRLMLQPRNHLTANGSNIDALFQEDVAQLETLNLDDFGHLTISFDVSMAPRGGVILPSPASNVAPMPLPVGAVVQAVWLTNASSASCLGNLFSTFVEFSPEERFPVEYGKPAYITVNSPPQSVCFTCATRRGAHGEPQLARVIAPLQPPTPAFMDRDVCWSFPVNAIADGADWGVLLLSIRLTSKPIDVQHQLANASPAPSADGRPHPDCPLGPAGMVLRWESDGHIARSTERRWRRDCVTEARPTREHVRHVFEASLQRINMDPSIHPLASAFFNRPFGEVTTLMMRELIIAMTFQCLPLADALKFCFAVMRSDSPVAITVADIVFILEHSLAPRTLDMPASEINRRVCEIFGSNHQQVTYEQFITYFAKNDTLWYDCGVVVEHGTEIRAQSARGVPKHSSDAPTASGPTTTHQVVEGRVGNPNASLNVSGQHHVNPSSGAPTNQDQTGSQWRTFTVRVIKTGRCFNVTAHITDVVRDVMAMVEATTNVAAHRQHWTYEGLPVDPRRTVGSVLPTVVPTGDISIAEKEESILLVLVFRDKNKRWEHRAPVSEKVLKLRAHVQQRTMIPLSRCVLRYAGNVMWDRHALDHYKLTDGSIIEITVE